MMQQPPQTNPMNNAAPAQPMPATQPQATQPAQNQQAAPQQGGPQPVENIGFNQDMQNILWSRVEFTFTPEDLSIMNKIITPETFPTLVKLFPEMQVLFEQATAIQNQQMTMRPQGQQMVQPAPQQTPNPLAQTGMPSDNLSKGLMG